MSTPVRTSSPRNKLGAIILAVVAIVALLGAVAVLIAILTTGASLGTLVSGLIVIAFLAAIGWFVLHRNLLNS
jgi:uncharacterized RDD family membrane protein YckC